MEPVLDIVRWVHVALGAVGLILFWIPIFAVKGGKVHVRFGRYFVWCAYVVIGTALFVCAVRLIDPLEGMSRGVHAFLGYLSIATLGFVRQAVLVVRTRREPVRLKDDTLHASLGVLCIASSIMIAAVGLLGDASMRIVLLSLSPIGVIAGINILGFRRNPSPTPRHWWYAHMSAILGAGIAFHTAFAVFGASRWVRLEGALQVVPWIAPTLIGVPAMAIWIRRYKRKFGEA